MKFHLLSTATAGFLVAMTSGTLAQPVYNLDPPQIINDYISLGEFNKTGDLEGWNHNTAAVKTEAVNGVLKVTTTSGDPWFYRNNLADLLADFATVQVRLRVLKGERTGWEVFWGTTGARGFSGGRRIGYTLDFEDNEYHLLEFDLSPILDGGSLTDFRIDCGQNAGNVMEVDYVRVGKISPDTDSDGLPDTVETGTGVYVGPRDTGTKPTQADSDGDGVNDSMEVTYNTDPNDPAQFPVPSIDHYSVNPATYITGVAITDNTPTVSLGTPAAFQVAPSLPAGLILNRTSGAITGTPSVATPLTDYTITASFPGNKTATNVLRIEVRNPYIDFTVDTMAFKKDVAISPVIPNIYGPAPISFSVQPALPEGLALDVATGEINGTPSSFSPLRTYTLSATYQGTPAAITALQIAVLDTPTAVADPEKKIVEWFSLGEFDDPAEASAFFRNNIDPLAIENGIATVVTTGGDPYFGRSPIALENDYKILEFRMKAGEGSTPFRFYWTEDAPGRGMSEATSWTLPEVNLDGQFHVYQVDFTSATIGPFVAMRMDPGDAVGTTLEFDYIRLGSFVPMMKPSLLIARQANNIVRISWPANAADYALYSTANLASAWTADTAEVKNEGALKYVEVKSDTATKFYRLQK